jgi:hypothetical protein
MMNPMVMPTNRVQQAIDYTNAASSPDMMDRLRAMQMGRSMGQGLSGLPTVGMEEGGSIANTAQGLASLGRQGDNVLVHMSPDELDTLSKLGTITYNPVTGLPEAFSLKKVFRAVRKVAPIALAIAAPYLGAAALGTTAAGLTTLQYAALTGLGSGVGSLIAGAKPKDALKAGVISGATAGLTKGIGQKFAGKGFNEPVVGSMNIADAPTGLNVAPSGTSGLEQVTNQSIQDIGKSAASDFAADIKGKGTFDLVKDFGGRALTGDIGSSIVESERIADEANRQQAEILNKPIDAGFNQQTGRFETAGAISPSRLTQADLRARALGQIGRERFLPTFRTAKLQQGGLIELAQGGEFSGMVPGEGGGMDDNVFMPIKEGKEQVGTLAVSPTEYVVDSYTMAALGDGNPEEGAKVMDETIKRIRKKAYGTTEQPKEIDGLQTLVPMIKEV